MRRLVVCVALALATVLIAGPATAADSPEPTPTSTASPSPAPSPTPTDGIRELPTSDDGADVYSVATIMIFFVIAMGVFVLIIRAGMRSSSSED